MMKFLLLLAVTVFAIALGVPAWYLPIAAVLFLVMESELDPSHVPKRYRAAVFLNGLVALAAVLRELSFVVVIQRLLDAHRQINLPNIRRRAHRLWAALLSVWTQFVYSVGKRYDTHSGKNGWSVVRDAPMSVLTMST